MATLQENKKRSRRIASFAIDIKKGGYNRAQINKAYYHFLDDAEFLFKVIKQEYDIGMRSIHRSFSSKRDRKFVVWRMIMAGILAERGISQEVIASLLGYEGVYPHSSIFHLLKNHKETLELPNNQMGYYADYSKRFFFIRELLSTQRDNRPPEKRRIFKGKQLGVADVSQKELRLFLEKALESLGVKYNPSSLDQEWPLLLGQYYVSKK